MQRVRISNCPTSCFLVKGRCRIPRGGGYGSHGYLLVMVSRFPALLSVYGTRTRTVARIVT